jgi:hypothetical protein
MTVLLNPYKAGSAGCRQLRNALKNLGVKTFILTKTPQSTKQLIVNWGNSEFKYPINAYPFIVNTPFSTGLMTNKRRFFKTVGHSTMVPQWTTDPLEAFKWEAKLLARHTLEGSGGAGIEIWEPEFEKSGLTFPGNAPLYTRYENKTHEFRVHLGRSYYGQEFTPFLVQRKIFRKTPERPVPPAGWEVRNHKNGFIFVQQSDFPTPTLVVETAKEFMSEYFQQMHFCALDVIYHEKKKTAFVLEGNTAPGLEGNTIQVYANYIKSLHEELT